MPKLQIYGKIAAVSLQIGMRYGAPKRRTSASGWAVPKPARKHNRQRHESVRLAELIDWEVFRRQWGELFSDNRGAPVMYTRLIAGLHYLKHTQKLSV